MIKAEVGAVQWATDMVHGVKTVLVGMGITWRHLWKPPVTMHYPDEKWRMPEAFRGLIKCDVDACIVCELCAKVCPVDCITIVWSREPGKSGKVAGRFIVDYQKCMYCGLCVDPCPTNAIWHSHEYENASYSRVPQTIDWASGQWRIKNPNAKPPKQEKPKAAAPKPAAAAAPAPAPVAAKATAVAAAPAPAGWPEPGSGAYPGVYSGIPGTEAAVGTKGTVTKVWVTDGCIVCDACKDAAPDVFDVTETNSIVRPESRDKWAELSQGIVDAAIGCPVNVIKYEIK